MLNHLLKILYKILFEINFLDKKDKYFQKYSIYKNKIEILDNIYENLKTKDKVFNKIYENLKIKDKKLNEINNILLEIKKTKSVKSIISTHTTPEKIKTIHKKYLNQKCFILGSAPSINDFDLSKLENEFVFCVNKGYLLKDKGLKNINAYCIADPEAFRDYGIEALQQNSKYFFLNTSVLYDLEDKENLFIYETLMEPKISEGFFQFDLTKPIYDNNTVILHALQIAVYMGFREIYLMGIELNFNPDKPHFYDSSEREKESCQKRSINNAPKMLKGLKKAYFILNERGVKIYNCSKNTENLDFIPFKSL